MRILLAQINPTIGDLAGNTRKILDGILYAKKYAADIVLFPELALTGYPPDDLLLLPHFIEALALPLEEIREASHGIVTIVGTPRLSTAKFGQPLYNSAAIFQDGRLLGFQDKSLLPTYDIFDERRYFEPGDSVGVWELCGFKVGITICEDIWQHGALLTSAVYARDPILELRSQQPDLVLNLSASPYSIAKFQNRLATCAKAATTLHCPFALCNQVGSNDGIIFDGRSLCMDQEGQLLHCAKAFEEDHYLIDLSHGNSPCQLEENGVSDLYQALVLGVRDYFHKSGFSRACLGLSGGIDSALVACIAVEALGKENVLAIVMPSRFSSESSISDAVQLAHTLGIEYLEIPIEGPFQSYLELLTPHFQGKAFDAAEENLQARIRGMIMMALSNKLGYIVLSTGNKSELAMGYSTLYGDMCGGLAVISDVSKRQIYALAQWINREREIIPISTMQKPPSAELRPNQKDSDSLPPYDVIDNVLQAYVEEHRSPKEIAKNFDYSIELVDHLIQLIHKNEYKRRQSAPGLRVTEKAFSVGRRFPIVQHWV